MPEFKEGPKSGRDWGRFTLEGKAMTFLNTPEMMSAIFPNGAKTNPADVLRKIPELMKGAEMSSTSLEERNAFLKVFAGIVPKDGSLQDRANLRRMIQKWDPSYILAERDRQNLLNILSGSE